MSSETEEGGGFLSCIATPFRIVWLALWPIIAIVLGILTGSVSGVVITLAVFGLTLVRTPMHTAKMLYVTATTDECFQGHLALPMRIAVMLVVPLVHLLFLVGITAFSATIGMLYYIGKATKVFYNHEYMETASKVKSNARLEPKSYFGKYYKKCQEFMSDDEDSHPTIYFIKGCLAFVLGLIVGLIPFLPFSVAVALITLYRLPINFYKTVKIALFTVVLKWDLKILALLTLPFIHIVFPLVTFIGAIIASYCYATYRATRNIFMGYSLFHKWNRFREELNNYYKAHQQFVSERCDTYDHPTGIPLGWNGTSYGIPIQRILKWQWDFLMMCIFATYGALVGTAGSIVVLTIKSIPILLYCFYKTVKSYCKGGCAMMLGTWPFYAVALLLLPAGVVLGLIIALLVCMLVGLCHGMIDYLEHGYLAAMYSPISLVASLDKEWTEKFSFGCSLFPGVDDENPYTNFDRRSQHHGASSSSETVTEARRRPDAYWDRFESQCRESASWLLYEKQWILLEDIQTFDPSVVQSIPAVAVLTVLVDSVLHEPALGKDDLLWKTDGTVCKEEDRPARDGIANHLLPMLLSIKKLLADRKEGLAQQPESMERLVALLCANSENETEALKKYLEMTTTDSTNQKISTDTINTIRTKINNVVLSILRVKPFQDRMSNIYEYDYAGEAAERGKRKSDGSIDSENDFGGGEKGLTCQPSTDPDIDNDTNNESHNDTDEEAEV